MPGIVIKKKVNLGFLGDDYKDAELVFRSIPVRDYEEILNEIDRLESSGDKRASIKMTIKALEDYFVSGKFPDDNGNLTPVTKEDISSGLDRMAAIKCFQVLSGQESDPKDILPSMMPSTTEQNPPTQS